MKRFCKSLVVDFLKLFGILNQILSKKENRILLFTNVPNFNDNNMALFKYLYKNDYPSKYVIYYSSPDYKKLRNKFPSNKNIFFISTFRAILVFLRAKFVFYDQGTLKIKPSPKQIVVSLWHGTPLKTIGVMVTGEKVINGWHKDISFIITTSKEFIPIFAKAFELDYKKIKVMGYPRNDYLFTPKNSSILQKLNIPHSNKIIIWMPTFRNNEEALLKNGNYIPIPFFEENETLTNLNDFCKEKDIGLIIKLHPHSILNNSITTLPTFSNLFIISNNLVFDSGIHNYELLSQCDALITDFSSVYFDFLLLNRPIYFAFDDLDEYKNSRGFTFDNPLEYMCGKIITEQHHFYETLNDFVLGIDKYESKRRELLTRIHTATKTNNANRLLLEKIGLSIE